MSVDKNYRPALPRRNEQDGNNFWSIEDYNNYFAVFLKHPDDLRNTYLLLSTLQMYIFESRFSLLRRANKYYSNYKGAASILFRNKKEAALQVIEIAKSLCDEPLLLPMMYITNAQNYFIAGDLDNSLLNLIKLLEHDSINKDDFQSDYWDPDVTTLAGIVHDIRLLYLLKNNIKEENKYYCRIKLYQAGRGRHCWFSKDDED